MAASLLQTFVAWALMAGGCRAVMASSAALRRKIVEVGEEIDGLNETTEWNDEVDQITLRKPWLPQKTLACCAEFEISSVKGVGWWWGEFEPTTVDLQNL